MPNFYLILHIFILLPFILTLIWILVYEEMGPGLGCHGKQLFNWHPMLMILGFGVFMTEGALAYRTFSSYITHSTAKLIHGICHLGMLACTILGLTAIILFHNEINVGHFFSLHSWIGIAVLGLAWIQFFMGLTVFGQFIPIPQSFRETIMPYHQALGYFLFCGSIATMASGLMQKQSFMRISIASHWDSVLMMSNVIGLSLLVSAIVVFTHWTLLPESLPERLS